MESVSLSGGESRFHPTNGSNAQRVRLGVLTVSDRASAGVYRDDSGPEILKFFHEAVKSEWEAVYRVIPDEGERIRSELIRMADEDDCCLIVTTGGTGPAKRDVTPEATESVCDRLMPGYAEQMRAISLKVVPTAVLSRQTAGLRGDTLIINLPGKPKAIRETIDEVFVSIPACVSIMKEDVYIETYDEVVKAFRPGAKKEKKDEKEKKAKEKKDEKKEKKEKKKDDKPKEPKKPKIETTKTDLDTEDSRMDLPLLDGDTFEASKAKLAALDKADKERVEKETALNELQSFNFDLGDKIYQEDHESASTEAERETIQAEVGQAFTLT